MASILVFLGLGVGLVPQGLIGRLFGFFPFPLRFGEGGRHGFQKMVDPIGQHPHLHGVAWQADPVVPLLDAGEMRKDGSQRPVHPARQDKENSRHGQDHEQDPASERQGRVVLQFPHVLGDVPGDGHDADGTPIRIEYPVVVGHEVLSILVDLLEKRHGGLHDLVEPWEHLTGDAQRMRLGRILERRAQLTNQGDVESVSLVDGHEHIAGDIH